MSALQLAAAPARASLRIRGGLVMILVAGRGAFRATSQLAPLALAAAWGPARFGDYAGAIGVSAWAMWVAVSGEKAALKLLPRTRRLGPDVTRLILAIGIVPVAAALFAIGAGLALSAGPAVLLVLLALLWSTSLGLLQVTAGLHRLRGAPGHDAAAFFGLAVAVAIATLLTARSGWSPLTQLSVISVAALMMGLVALLRLPGIGRAASLRPARNRSPRRIAGGVLRTCVLLGLPELLGGVSVAVCYLALTVTGQRTESGSFYLAAVVSGICSAAVIYLLRLGQPALSARLRGPAAVRARTRARQVLGVAVVISAVCAGALAVLIAAGAAGSGRSDGWLLLGALTVVEITLFALVTFAGYLVENTNDRAPRITSAAAVAGLGAAALGVVVLVPTTGAAGAMGALVVSLGATALAMRRGLSRFESSRFEPSRFDVSRPVRERAALLGFSRRRWDRAHARLVRSSFADVPFYRERWALDGNRTPATITGLDGRLEDLAPLGDPSPQPKPIPTLDDLAVLRDCGLWHLDWRRVYARNTPDGVAVSLLRQRSPRLVDIVVTPGQRRMVTCPRHRTPGVTA
jgi:hypothetical protein